MCNPCGVKLEQALYGTWKLEFLMASNNSALNSVQIAFSCLMLANAYASSVASVVVGVDQMLPRTETCMFQGTASETLQADYMLTNPGRFGIR